MAQRTIQIADKPTLDLVKQTLESIAGNSGGLSVLECSGESVIDYVNESVSTLPYSFYGGCAVVLNNEIHILGSINNSDYTKHYKWNGTSWVSVSTLPYIFYYGSAIVYNNEIHILGSANNSDYTKHYKWNGTSWVSVSTLPYNFCYGCAVVLNNEIHILGSGNYNRQTKHYKWNGTSWVSVSTLPYNFYYGSAIVYNNEIHILGSANNSDYTNYTKHYKVNTFYKKLSFYLKHNQKIGVIYDLGKVTTLTNCTKEENNLLVTEDGLTEFQIQTADENIVLTVKG